MSRRASARTSWYATGRPPSRNGRHVKVRDAFYSSPIVPRVLNAEFDQGNHRARRRERHAGLRWQGGVRQVSAVRVQAERQPWYDIEFSDDVFLITAEAAQAYLDQQKQPTSPPPGGTMEPGASPTPTSSGTPATPTGNSPQQPTPAPSSGSSSKISSIRWTGDVPAQKWMNFLYQGAFPLCYYLRTATPHPGGSCANRRPLKATTR
jgi:hypothetical protein